MGFQAKYGWILEDRLDTDIATGTGLLTGVDPHVMCLIQSEAQKREQMRGPGSPQIKIM